MREMVNKVLKELSPVTDEIKKSTILKEDLGFDSLKMVQLIVSLEEAFNFEFSESDLDPEKLITVADLYTLVERYG